MQTLSHLFPGTHHAAAIKALEDLYLEIDQKIADWKQVGRLSCPPGCGICCSKFEPGLLAIEADYAALYLCYEKPGLLEKINFKQDTKHCVFYDPENPHHCPIYPARALVCRLFAFSAVTDKNNNPAFKLCTHIAPELKKRIYTGSEIRESFHAPLPVMQDYSIRAVNINAGADDPPLPLRQRIPQSVGKVKLLAALTCQ